ncbi:MAG TPA: prolipoprotein diacylglyceryl transferase family protein [Terriglobales bacterium]|nr:prolipoprotein diacylglyceryl transferase family protein [Terriglobales bacterium]
MHFPVYIYVAGVRIHPHLLFESLAYVSGVLLYLWMRRRSGDFVADPVRWSVITAAVAGGALGSKLMYLLEDPAATLRHLGDPFYLMGGKSIVGGLVGGLIAVEWVKKYMGEKQSTGDLFAIPAAMAIALGRLGCFLTGLSDNTYGVATGLPWGVDFGDGIRRHPTQIYEIVFLLALLPALQFARRSIARSATTAKPDRQQSLAGRFRSGDTFKLFMVSYMAFRLVCDGLKPYVHVALGLCSIQWICLLVLLYYAKDIGRWITPQKPVSREVTEATQEAAGGAF